MNDGFTLGLGLLDFLNPILMCFFFLYTVGKIKGFMKKSFWILYIIGYILVLGAGFIIPAYKCYVGITKIDFELPVKFVTIVNIGYAISGFSIFIGTLNRSNKNLSVIAPVSLLNSIIVVLGATGLLLIDISYIKMAIKKKRRLALICICYSMAVTFGLAFVGALLDETNVIIHWIEEIVNISGMISLCLGGYLIFSNKENVVS